MCVGKMIHAELLFVRNKDYIDVAHLCLSYPPTTERLNNQQAVWPLTAALLNLTVVLFFKRI